MLKHALLVLLTLGLVGTAWSDGTVKERQTAVKLYRGTSIIAASDPNSSVYVENLTPARCEDLREAAWEEEALTRSAGVATYKCQVEERAIIQFHAAPEVCGERPAPDEQATRTCPAGTVGTWLQDRRWTQRPYPECWVQGAWEPAAPPEGMCAPDAPPERLPAPTNVRAEAISTSGIRVRWNAVSGASAYSVRRCIGATCDPVSQLLCTPNLEASHVTLPPELTVGYRLVASRTANCSDLGEPSAIVRGTTLAEPAPVSGTAPLSWTPPTRNTDGSVLTNLAGTRIHYGTDPDALVQTIQINSPAASSYTVGGLSPGTWYFAVRAYNTGGRESALSPLVMKVVQ